MPPRLDPPDALVPTGGEQILAERAAEMLGELAMAKEDIKLTVVDQPDVVVPLPARAVELMHRVLSAMASGTPVSLIPHDAELSTQQAADFLNVSRPYFVKLLDEGKLAHSKAGRHRRVKFKDLMEYRDASRIARRAALDELAEEERRLGLE